MILFMVFLFLINGINSMMRVFVLFDRSGISGSDDIIINGIYSTVGGKRRGRLWEEN